MTLFWSRRAPACRIVLELGRDPVPSPRPKHRDGRSPRRATARPARAPRCNRRSALRRGRPVRRARGRARPTPPRDRPARTSCGRTSRPRARRRARSPRPRRWEGRAPWTARYCGDQGTNQGLPGRGDGLLRRGVLATPNRSANPQGAIVRISSVRQVPARSGARRTSRRGSPTRSRADSSTPVTCACTPSSVATARRCCSSTAGPRPGTPGAT